MSGAVTGLNQSKVTTKPTAGSTDVGSALGKQNLFGGVAGNWSGASHTSALDPTTYGKNASALSNEYYTRLADRVNNRVRWGGGENIMFGLNAGSGPTATKVGEYNGQVSARDKMETQDTRMQELNNEVQKQKDIWNELEKGKQGELSRQAITKNQNQALINLFQEQGMVPLRLSEQEGRADIARLAGLQTEIQNREINAALNTMYHNLARIDPQTANEFRKVQDVVTTSFGEAVSGNLMTQLYTTLTKGTN